MHNFYMFSITNLHIYRAFDGLYIPFPHSDDQASLVLEQITVLGPRLRSGVLRSAGHERTFGSEVLQWGVFQQSSTLQQVWLEDEQSMK